MFHHLSWWYKLFNKNFNGGHESILGGIVIHCLLIVFGGTGDLAHRKIYPAIYNLYVSGHLPERFAMVAIGRRDKTEEAFRGEAADAIRRYTRENRGTQEDINKIVSRFFYRRADFTEYDGYEELKEYMNILDDKFQTGGNRVFYLAVAPEHFGTIVSNLARCGLTSQENGFKRVVIEKPFGKDLRSAVELNNIITSVFREDQIYRIDHFLGKEMLQNIMVIRFANALFEPLWNNKYIDHIQITSSETVGVESRGGYYETAGAMRDMMQNHMLQLLMLTAMEAPVSLDTHAIRDEKVKVLKAIAPMDPVKASRNVVRGQYGEGIIYGRRVPAYRSEHRVSPESDTETYMAMKLEVENFRWAGVPFYLRTGKRMPAKTTKIVIQFLPLPGILYYKEFNKLEPNRLIIEIQPREGVIIRFNGKKPGTKSQIIPVELDFCQNCAVGEVSPDAYEKLLLDVMNGDSTLFTRWDEVEYSWKLMDGISEVWSRQKPAFPNYAAGTWGPAEADELLQRDGRRWFND
ncbi:MAG TPA: glucose-6-phosphate dehydrogenase [Clostridiales bacterium]|nr:glucose-6-phosphate dehydrogenase [Clostridiales bacterium]